MRLGLQHMSVGVLESDFVSLWGPFNPVVLILAFLEALAERVRPASQIFSRNKKLNHVCHVSLEGCCALLTSELIKLLQSIGALFYCLNFGRFMTKHWKKKVEAQPIDHDYILFDQDDGPDSQVVMAVIVDNCGLATTKVRKSHKYLPLKPVQTNESN